MVTFFLGIALMGTAQASDDGQGFAPLVSVVHDNDAFVLGTFDARQSLSRRALTTFQFQDADGYAWSQRSVWERLGNEAAFDRSLSDIRKRAVPLQIIQSVFTFAPAAAMAGYAVSFQTSDTPPDPVPFAAVGLASAALGIGLRVHTFKRSQKLRADLGVQGIAMAESATMFPR
jgi:hypothetical protein